MIRKAKDREYEPGQFVTADMENDPAGCVLAIGATGPDDNYQVFGGWKTFLDWLIPKARRKAAWRDVYMHNGAGYDYLSLIKQLRSLGFKCQIEYIMVDGRGIGATLDFGRFTIRLKDSLRVLPAGLAALGETFDIEHKKMAGNAWELWQTDQEKFYQYLRHDVLGLREILIRFEEMINDEFEAVGKLPWTLPALALKLWQFTIKKPIRTPWSDKLKDFSRLAYSGGRCQVNRPGVFAGVNAYDVNSMYPAVMRENVFPASYAGAWSKTFDPAGAGLYEVSYEQPADLPPLLLDANSRQFRHSGRGVFCTPELNELLAIGGRFQVSLGYVFWHTAPIFKVFVNRYWGVRRRAQLEGDSGLDYVAKLILNSLYGKMAQSGRAHMVTKLTADEMRERLASRQPYADYGNFQVIERAGRSEHEFTAVAAFVTCYARLALWQQIKSNPDFLYCDTDSIHMTGELSPAVVGSDLGQWKPVHLGVMAAYAGRKSYALALPDGSKVVKWKGIPAGPLTFAGVSSLANREVDEIAVQYATPPTPREALLIGREPGVWLDRERTAKIAID